MYCQLCTAFYFFGHFIFSGLLRKQPSQVDHLAKLLDSDVYLHGEDTDLLVILIHNISSVSTDNTIILKTRADEWNIAQTTAALPKQSRDCFLFEMLFLEVIPRGTSYI